MVLKNEDTRSVGIDLVEVQRFTLLLNKKNKVFFEKVFMKTEVEYCLTYKASAEHFAGIFAAKEAVSKAMGVHKYPYSEIEIRHTKHGAPVAYYRGKKIPISISITHTKHVAAAIAIK